MSKLTGIALVIYMPLTFYAEEFNFKHGVRRRAPTPVPQTPTMRTSLSVVPARVALCRGDLSHHHRDASSPAGGKHVRRPHVARAASG